MVSELNNAWYKIENIDTLDSPSIAIYKANLEYNVDHIIRLAKGETERLMLHLKTNKMPKVVRHLIQKGLTNFKSATIAEAEMAAMEGANKVLIAHQLVGPKIGRLFKLINMYQETEFSTILDNCTTALLLAQHAKMNKVTIPVYIDINNGMNRTGIELGPELTELINVISSSSYLQFKGLHVYDGHIRDTEFNNRKDRVEEALKPVLTFFNKIKASYPNLILVCGGTPTFTSHISENERMASPGTCVLWDWGYNDILLEQSFKYAALIITRVISKPTKDIVTIDLGHKAIASENPIDKRVKFLNLDRYELLSQSEEHGVLKVDNWNQIEIGDVFYGVPYHICPTINLYEQACLIENNMNVDIWEVFGGKRKITI